MLVEVWDVTAVNMGVRVLTIDVCSAVVIEMPVDIVIDVLTTIIVGVGIPVLVDMYPGVGWDRETVLFPFDFRVWMPGHRTLED